MDQVFGGNAMISNFDLNEEYDGEDENDENFENEEPKLQGLSLVEVNALTFQIEDEAYDFYQSFGKEKGFNVRKNSVQRRKDDKIRLRIFLCSREGEQSKKDDEVVERTREPNGETIVGCGAHLCIGYDKKKNLYVVASFEDEHNHSLTPQGRVQFLRSHIFINSSVIAKARTMHIVGISSSKIMDYMVQKHNGYENCGFIQKDLSNALDTDYGEDMLKGDAEAALAYLSAKK